MVKRAEPSTSPRPSDFDRDYRDLEPSKMEQLGAKVLELGERVERIDAECFSIDERLAEIEAGLAIARKLVEDLSAATRAVPPPRVVVDIITKGGADE